MSDEILVPAIIQCEIDKARLGVRPTPAQEMEAIAKAILALRHSKSETMRKAYREVLRKELRKRQKSGEE
ncbi:hypothetical protein [Pseudoxanthomonas mexicana]